MNTIERLEKWNNGHKARSVNIHIDNGYGATCWVVELNHEHGKTTGYEVSFYDVSEEMEKQGLTVDGEAKKLGVVFPRTFEEQENDETNSWPGLDKTINATIDGFENGIWKKKA